MTAREEAEKALAGSGPVAKAWGDFVRHINREFGGRDA